MVNIKHNRKGFSLVELIVVIAIMAVLAGVVTGAIYGQKNKQTDNIAKVEASQILMSARNVYILATKHEGEDFNREYLIGELTDMFPDVITLNEAGSANEHKYYVDVIEQDGEAKYISIAFISAKRNGNEIVQYYSIEKAIFVESME